TGPRRPTLADLNQAVRVRIRERFEEHCTNDAEDRGVGADADGDREHGDERRDRCFSNQPECVPEFVQHGCPYGRRDVFTSLLPHIPTSSHPYFLTSSDQHDTHLWLFFAPSFSSSASASGHGWMRCTGPFAMSAVVLPSRLTALTSAPFETRY